MYIENQRMTSLCSDFFQIYLIIMKIEGFPENFSLISQVVWGKIDSNILNVLIWREGDGVPNNGS